MKHQYYTRICFYNGLNPWRKDLFVINDFVNINSKSIIPRLNIDYLSKATPAHSNAPVPQALVDLGNVAKHQCYQDPHAVHSSSGGETAAETNRKKRERKGEY